MTESRETPESEFSDEDPKPGAPPADNGDGETPPVGEVEVEAASAEVGEEAAEEEENPVWTPEPEKLLCALLFAAREYQSARTLRDILGEEWDTPRLRRLLNSVNQMLADADLPFEAIEAEGTFRLRTSPKYFPWVRKLFKEPPPRRLSQAALETLAIVAYKQPITKAEIESIRGVHVDGSLKTLLDKKLIDIGRRSDAMGNAFTYRTTREFLRYFGINRIPDDLPRLSDFEGILNAQTLLPQIGPGGEVRSLTQPEPDSEQMSLGVESGPA